MSQVALIRKRLLLCCLWVAGVLSQGLHEARGQVPALLSYQGRVEVGTNAFAGNGQFKFALVNGNGSQVYQFFRMLLQ